MIAVVSCFWKFMGKFWLILLPATKKTQEHYCVVRALRQPFRANEKHHPKQKLCCQQMVNTKNKFAKGIDSSKQLIGQVPFN